MPRNIVRVAGLSVFAAPENTVLLKHNRVCECNVLAECRVSQNDFYRDVMTCLLIRRFVTTATIIVSTTKRQNGKNITEKSLLDEHKTIKQSLDIFKTSLNMSFVQSFKNIQK